MELFLLRHSEYERLYNCSMISIESIPLEKRQFPCQSIAIIILCAIYYILYAPCLYSISKHLSNSCYKILFFIGIGDLAILWILGFWFVYMSLTGQVFCSNPSLGYCIGLMRMTTGLWFCESSGDILLAFNRCVDILLPKISKTLFDGYRTWIWCGFCLGYSLFWTIFMKPAVYNSTLFGAFLFNPFAGYIDFPAETYSSQLYVYHNYSVGYGLPTIYLIFFIGFFIKFKALHSASGNLISSAELMTFLQVFLISLLNSLATLMYVPLQHVSPETQAILMSISLFAWLHIHGFPPVIYLLLNKSIRQDCKILLLKIYRRNITTKVKNANITIMYKGSGDES